MHFDADYIRALEVRPAADRRAGHRHRPAGDAADRVGWRSSIRDVLLFPYMRPEVPRGMGSPAAVLHEGELWSVGGRSGPEDFGDVYRYDATADRWVPGPAIAPRGTGGAIVVSGAIHYFGGESQSAQRVLDEVLRLDPRSNEWHRVTHLPTARNFARVVAFKQAYWVIGGSTDYGSSHASVGSTRVERYVP
jgi:N-acetylneuraminic acid mutarotase